MLLCADICLQVTVAGSDGSAGAVAFRQVPWGAQASRGLRAGVPISSLFTTEIERLDEQALAGPWRYPGNMLTEQSYDDHSSIHDDDTAQKLGFRGGAVEGPTHFSQLAPSGVAIWGGRIPGPRLRLGSLPNPPL